VTYPIQNFPAAGKTFYVDLLDYTMGKAAPADANALFDQISVQIRG
jgi:hypothetical protein